MSRFNTGNPLGSGSPLDLDDNAKNMDLAVNAEQDTFQDRLGKSRLTWAGIVKAGTGDPAIAVDAAARAEAAASDVEQNAEQIAQDAAQQAVAGVVAAVDGAVDQAEDAATRAEASAIAAYTSGNLFNATAQGLAATVDGQFFLLRTRDPQVFDVYFNNGGAAILQPNQFSVALNFSTPATLVNAQLSINIQARTATLTRGREAQALADGRYISINSDQTATYSTKYPNAPTYFYLEEGTGTLAVTVAPATPTPRSFLLATTYNGDLYAPYDSHSRVSAIGPTGDIISNYNSPVVQASLSADASLSINLQNKTAILNAPNNSVIALSDRKYKEIPKGIQEVEFNLPYPRGVAYFFVTADTGELAVLGAPAVPPAGSFLLATTYNGDLYAPYDSHSRVSAIGPTGDIIPNPNAASGSGGLPPPFDPATMRGVFPRKLYFMDGKPLRLYKKPCFSTNEQDTDAVDFWIDTGSSAVADRFLQANDTVVLDPSSLGAELSFNYKSKTASNTRYIGTADVDIAAEDAIEGTSINLLMFGDSLTEGGMTDALGRALQARGATVTPVGTYISAVNGNNRSEGRGYWNYRSFIGKDNYSSGVGPHTRSAGGKTNTSKFENPFLKLASAQDKADHPTWCFRFTGADRELSYAEDTDKTGDFYIFDFAWYRSEHSVAAPDIITIALSTNDINLDRSTYTQEERLQFMRLGLEVMVRQIRADLPATPIGIIPAPAWSSTDIGDGRWKAETASWIDQCMTDVESLNTELGNISVVPVWPFMSEDWAYPYASRAPLNPTSSVQVNQITDWVHFYSVGVDQYVSVLEAWTACTI